MPIYEYRCAACGFQKEYLQKLSDPVLTDCPECQKASFGKMLTAAGFQLKGSGWYATDFKSSGSKPAAAAAGESKTAESSAAPAHSCGSGACSTCS
ncbi:MAG TPA: FmdB family zinc ribbon protein [Burkholderiales bacterium]|jgi:putative FmdB family regulatory protein|nr:FmdB family zinc ribbon protein [Burkholderiales bacterium]